jgi:hypothetical protein
MAAEMYPNIRDMTDDIIEMIAQHLPNDSQYVLGIILRRQTTLKVSHPYTKFRAPILHRAHNIFAEYREPYVIKTQNDLRSFYDDININNRDRFDRLSRALYMSSGIEFNNCSEWFANKFYHILPKIIIFLDVLNKKIGRSLTIYMRNMQIVYNGNELIYHGDVVMRGCKLLKMIITCANFISYNCKMSRTVITTTNKIWMRDTLLFDSCINAKEFVYLGAYNILNATDNKINIADSAHLVANVRRIGPIKKYETDGFTTNITDFTNVQRLRWPKDIHITGSPNIVIPYYDHNYSSRKTFIHIHLPCRLIKLRIIAYSQSDLSKLECPYQIIIHSKQHIPIDCYIIRQSLDKKCTHATSANISEHINITIAHVYSDQ